MAIDTTNLFARCLPARHIDVAQCGALTACSAIQVTADELATIYGSDETAYKIHGHLLGSDIAGRMIGAKRNQMYDFWQSNTRFLSARNLSLSPAGGGMHMIAPFLRMKRRRTINNAFWTVLVKSSTAGYNQTDNIVLQVKSHSNIPEAAEYFPVGMYFYVAGTAPGSGDPVTGDVQYNLAFRVVSVDDLTVDVGGENYMEITFAPNNAASVYLSKGVVLENKAKVPTLLAGATLGTGVRGTNNVARAESFCSQIPALNTNQMLPTWIQGTRWTLCKDELVQRYIDLLSKTNDFYNEYAKVGEVERERQVRADFEANHANALWWQKPISTNQTLTLWEALANIVVPSTSNMALSVEGKCVGKKANATGLYEQLSECDRVIDAEGDALDFRKLRNTFYNLQRQREASGIDSNIIEIFGESRYLRNMALRGFVDYFKTDIGTDVYRLTNEIQSGKAEQGPFGFRFHRFNLDYPNVEVRLVTHRMFDDWAAARRYDNGGAFSSSGNMIWMLDWTAIYQAIIDASTVTNKSADRATAAAVNDDYMCVSELPQREVELHDRTYGVVLEDETTQLVIENLGQDFTVTAEDHEETYLDLI